VRLSEAIRMGSLLIEEPRATDINACAVTMACNAIGVQVESEPLAKDYYNHLLENWPWLQGKTVTCPFKRYELTGTTIVWLPFDQYVMSGKMTIDQLADWIRSIEPEEHEPTNNNPLDENDVLSYSNPVAVHHK
jgi:hypothetical protein